MRKKKPEKANRAPFGGFPRLSGFTFVELVVAMSIGAVVIVISVMAYAAIGRAVPARRQTGVTIGLTNMVNFYKLSGSTIAVSEAPNFASAAMAESMKNRLLQDVSMATAVCCLVRNEANVLRPTNLTLPAGLDARTLSSPEQFRTQLIDSNSVVYTNFNGTNWNGATAATNLSIYILSSTNSATNIAVNAIYETDFVTVTNAPAGVYASVRRYVGDSMTDYYHVFYPGQTNNAFLRPVAAYFTPSSIASGDIRYRQAAKRPFYMVWWPDPARKSLASSFPSETTNNTNNARSDYMNQSGVTPYFFVIPAYPSL